MSEQEEAPIESPKYNSSLSIVIPLVLVVLLVAGLGIYISKGTGVEEDIIDQRLEEFAVLLSQLSDEKAGVGYSFIYEKVEAKGGDTTREAVIVNPEFRYQKVNANGEIIDAKEFLTNAITLRYDVTGMDKLQFAIKEPVTVFLKQGKFVLHPRGTLDGAFVMHEETSEEGIKELSQRLTLTLPNEGFAVDHDDRRVAKLTYTQPSPMTLATTQVVAEGERPERMLSVALQDVQLLGENIPLGASLEALSVEGEWNPTVGDRIAIDYDVEIQGLGFTGIETPLLPASLSLEADYEGLPVYTKEQLSAQLVNSPIYLDIEKGQLTLGQTHLQLEGIMENEGQGFLPLVDAHFEVREFAPLYDLLVAQGNIEPQSESGVLAELFAQEITGLPLSELQDASFDIVRGEDRAFVIGNTTFEELVAIWVAQKFSKKGSSSLEKQEIEGAFEGAEQPTTDTQE